MQFSRSRVSSKLNTLQFPYGNCGRTEVRVSQAEPERLEYLAILRLANLATASPFERGQFFKNCQRAGVSRRVLPHN